MIALGMAAVVPTRAGDVASHANPARGYADAVARAQRIIAGETDLVAEGGATILLLHGHPTARAVVLFHGFTDSPKQFADLADSLYRAGENVFVPRLPHHAERGRTVRELARLTATELCRLADQSVDIASGLGDSVIVAGLSVGGTMAAWSAEHRREVKRAVVIAPALEAAHVPSMLERPLVNLGAHVPNLTRSAASDTTRPDREPGFTTHGLAAVLRLGMAVKQEADRRAPEHAEVLFLVNAHDGTVKSGPVLDIARTWRRQSVPVSVYEFPDSLRLPHNVIDPLGGSMERATVLELIGTLVDGGEPPRWVVRR
jgi:pimeloyl-ACP methyl ester carboxylesterase